MHHARTERLKSALGCDAVLRNHCDGPADGIAGLVLLNRTDHPRDGQSI